LCPFSIVVGQNLGITSPKPRYMHLGHNL